MPKGIIRQLNRERDSGIIKTEQGNSLCFDRSQLQGLSFDSRLEWLQVEFDIGKGVDGRAQAIRIRSVRPRGR